LHIDVDAQANLVIVKVKHGVEMFQEEISDQKQIGVLVWQIILMDFDKTLAWVALEQILGSWNFVYIAR
jgi:hypothetical protein